FRGSMGPGDPPLVDSDIVPLNRTTQDQPGDAEYAAVLMNNGCSCSGYHSKLNTLVQQINNAHIPYGVKFNSNSVTFTAINLLGLTAPKLPLDVRDKVWGWNPLPPMTTK